MKMTGWMALLAVKLRGGRILGKATRHAHRHRFGGENAQQAEILEVRSVPSTVNAVDDAIAVAHNGMSCGNVLTNDTIPMAGRFDENMNPLPDPTITYSYSGPSETLSLDCVPTSSGFGQFIYVPPSSLINATVSFTYTITDPVTSDTNTATVTFTITDNSTITVQDDADGSMLAVEETRDVTVLVVTSGDTDSDGDDLTIQSISACTQGSAVASSDGKSVIYTPPIDGMQMEEVEMDVELGDGHGNSAFQKLTIDVSGGVGGPGVFLATRKLPLLARHSFIIIIPQDQASYATNPDFARTITIRGTDFHYATISGNPQDPTDPNNDRMDSFLNDGADDPKKGVVHRAWGFNCESNDIYNLLQKNENYHFRADLVQYKLVPWGDDNDDEFDANCHGYAHGLLNVLGYWTDGVGIAQGFDEMVPASFFDP